MQMPAHDAFDVVVAAQDRLQLAGSAQQPHGVHVRDAGGEGRVVHRDQGRGGRVQVGLQPVEPSGVELAVG